MALAYVALGSNLANPIRQIKMAIHSLDQLPQSDLIQASSLYRTAPIGCEPDQPDYINAVALIHTSLEPFALLAALQQLELDFGRQRLYFNSPRTLDLDLLLYDDKIIESEKLTVPHPRMHERAFVLRPLVEIQPLCLIPKKGPAQMWLAQCENQSITHLPAIMQDDHQEHYVYHV